MAAYSLNSLGQCTFTVTPDLALEPSTPEIDDEIDDIYEHFSDMYLGTTAPSAGALTSATDDYDDLGIVVSGGTITGASIGSYNDLSFLRTFARHLKFDATDTDIIDRANNAVWLAYQQFCDGDLGIDGGGYAFRNFARPTILLNGFLTAENKERFEYILYRHSGEYEHFWTPTYDHAYQSLNGTINTDFIYNVLDVLMAYGAWHETEDERYRYMRGFKRYVERFFSHTVGSSDGIKIDGSGFHHWSAYESYMYAYNTAQNVVFCIAGTTFEPSVESYLFFRDAVLARLAYANDNGIKPLSIIGRNPGQRGLTHSSGGLRRLAIAGGEILDLPHADPEIAGIYNRIWGVEPDFGYDVIAPLSSQEGYYQFNYGNAGVYRKSNWIAVSKGFTDNLFGAEIYITSNRYGRYQSYGALEIIYPGNIETGAGFDIATWDWNYNPGATVVHLPWDELHAERGRIDEIQEHRFAGALSFKNKNSNSLSELHGTYGLFAMDFQEREGLGWSTTFSSNNHNATFRFKKSHFTFDDMIVCLGSNINNDDSDNPTVTTLYQRLDNKPTGVVVDGIAEDGTTTFDETTDHWIISNYGTGFYVFADGGQLSTRAGDQQTPNQNENDPTAYLDNPIADYNIGYLDHGTAPVDASFEYVVIPNASTVVMSGFEDDVVAGDKPYTVHQQDEVAHIVQHNELNTWGYAIFENSTLLSHPGKLDSVSHACMVMYNENAAEDSLLLALTDPELDFGWRDYDLSVGKTIEIKLSGIWELAEAYPDVSITGYEDDKTVVQIVTIDGMPEEALFVAAVGCEDIQAGLSVDPTLCVGGTLEGSFAIVPDGAVINWTFDGMTTTGETFSAVAGTPGDFDLDINFVSADCSFDTTVAITVLSGYAETLPVVSICEGDSALIFGIYQSEPGIYYDSLVTAAGCDSVYNQTLEIAPAYFEELDLISICEGDSALIFGSYEFELGYYYDTLTAVNGCDSIIAQYLNLYPTYEITEDISYICEGESILVFGEEVSETGVYYDSLLTIYGCDSVRIKTVIVTANYDVTLPPVSICEGDSILIFGTYETEAGVYTNSLSSVYGCDSIITQAVNVNPAYEIVEETVYICEGESAFVFGDEVFEAGTYYDSLLTDSGCDSIHVQSVVVYPTHLITLAPVSICEGDSLLLFGAYRSTAGLYTDSLTSVHGCDSVITQILNINPVYEITEAPSFICDGESILVFGVEVSEAGTYYDSLLTVNGCDSVRVKTVIVNPAYFTELDPIHLCEGDSVMVFDNYQSAGGIYYDSLLTEAGCDSVFAREIIIESIHVTNLDLISICEGDSVFVFDTYYSESGLFLDTVTSIYGCDSILIQEVIVNPVYSVELEPIYICEGDSTLIFGNYQSIGGYYSDTLATVSGCDSVLVQPLYLNLGYLFELDLAPVCVGDSVLVFGIYQSEAGVYYDSLVSVNGCDSVFVQEVIVNELPDVTFDPFENDTICMHSGPIALGGFPEGGAFFGPGVLEEQFFAELTGAGVFTIWYEYTDENGCMVTDSSTITIVDCLGVQEFELVEARVYPNPFINQTYIHFAVPEIGDKSLVIYDISGKEIYRIENIEGSKVMIPNAHFEAGNYLLVLKENKSDIVVYRTQIQVN